MIEIDWSKQHCGIHQGDLLDLVAFMPDLIPLIKTFPENPEDFIWDVKVHMLMPGQWPCIPNWHFDNIPRINNVQDYSLIQPEVPMYLWVSGEPLTEFRKNGKTWFVKPNTWTKFTQCDEHRGTRSEEFTWRGFIRGTHRKITSGIRNGQNSLRRHSQVYLNADEFKW